MKPGSRSFRFAGNMTWSLAGHFLGAAANLLIIPYLVRSLGNQLYGLYILLFAMAGYLGLASLGASAAAAKYAAATSADKNGRALRDSFRHSLCVQGGGALLAAAAAALLAQTLAFRLFHVPKDLHPIAAYLLRCAAAGAVFTAVIESCLGTMQGVQRFDLCNWIVGMRSVVMPLGSAVLLYEGFGLRALGAWYVALHAAAAALAATLAVEAMGRYPVHAKDAPLAFATFLRWSLGQWLGGWAWTVTFQFDRIFVARFVSLSGLTLYSVPAGLLQRLQVLPGMVSTSALPLLSEARRPGQEEELRRMYLKSVRLLLWTTLPAFTLLAALMPQFLGLWVGEEFGAHSVLPARLLCAAQMWIVLAAMPVTVVSARDNPWYLPALQWAQALVSLAFWWTLVPRWGLPAVAAGALAAQMLPCLFHIAIVHRRYLHLPLGRYLCDGLAAPFISAGLVLAAILPLHAWATSWLSLMATVASGLSIFYGSTWLLMPQEDKLLLKNWIAHHLTLEPA